MMRPHPFSRMCGTTRLTRSTAANRFNSNTLLHSSSGVPSSVLPPPAVPALLTRMSIAPNSPNVSSTSFWRSASSIRSATTASARAPPRSPSSPAACRSSSSLREQIETLHPSSTSASEMPRPMPLLPPVTMATLPSSSRFKSVSFR